MKLVICMLFLMSTLTDAKGMIQQRCGNTRLCFLCGCGNKSVFNISCEENQVIQMEPGGNVMREGDSDSDYNCQINNYTQCYKNIQSIPSTPSTLQERIEVYKNCTLKNSCEVNIKERIQTRKKRLVNYPFYCLHKSSIEMISSKLKKNIPNPILYFSGEKYKGQKIDCDCSVTGSTLFRLELLLIHLKPHTCSKIKFISEIHQLLFGCSTNGSTKFFHRSYYDIGTDFKLEIRGMEPDVEDVLFFRLHGKNLAVNCSGCTNSTDTTTTEHSTLDASTLDTTTTLDVLAPTASTDQTNSAATATLGGILAAVIIIVIVGIAVYCFIRRRRNQQKSQNTPKNASGNGEQSQYNYIDITQDKHGYSYTNSTESNVVQNGDTSKHPVNALKNIPKTIDFKDRSNNQYHVLEVDTYSAPANTRADAGAKHMPGKGRRKQDDYDHINDDSKSKPTNNDNYNHIDAKMVVLSSDATINNTTPYDDYNHIGDTNGFSKDKLKPKQKNQVSGNQNTSYDNVNLEPDETPSSTEDVDTYNHLQN